MAVDPTEIAKAEYESLRSELISRTQSQATIVTAALTLVGAVGGFALSKEGREEILFVLPFALSALGVLLVEGTRANHRMAHYLREYAWPRMFGAGEVPWSWEDLIERYRQTHQLRVSPHSVAGAAPVLLVLVLPSVVALGLTLDEARHDGLWPLWIGGLFAMATFGWVANKLRQQDDWPPQMPAASPQPRRECLDDRERVQRRPWTTPSSGD